MNKSEAGRHGDPRYHAETIAELKALVERLTDQLARVTAERDSARRLAEAATRRADAAEERAAKPVHADDRWGD